jgi:hypothetical protein
VGRPFRRAGLADSNVRQCEPLGDGRLRRALAVVVGGTTIRRRRLGLGLAMAWPRLSARVHDGRGSDTRVSRGGVVTAMTPSRAEAEPDRQLPPSVDKPVNGMPLRGYFSAAVDKGMHRSTKSLRVVLGICDASTWTKRGKTDSRCDVNDGDGVDAPPPLAPDVDAHGGGSSSPTWARWPISTAEV